MAYDDPVEQIIRIRFDGLSEAPRQFQEAITAVNQFDQSLQALQKNQASLQKQFNSAGPQQQAKIQSQLNTIAYQIDQATTSREQAVGHADDQYARLQQYNDLARRITTIEQKRTTPPTPPGPAENYSPATQQAYADKQSELKDAQGKYQRARTDASKSKWADEIDRLQGELNQVLEGFVRQTYQKPTEEIRRRLQDLKRQTGQEPTNAQFAQVERDVNQGRVITPEEDEDLSARKLGAMNPAAARWQRIRKALSPSTMWKNLTEFGGVNAGYAAMQLGDEVGQYAELNMSGNRVSPEARQRSLYGLLPGAGAAIGSLFGWTGSLAGGGVGSLAQGLLGADSERREKLRDAGEEIAASQGQIATAGRLYAQVIEDAAKRAGTPAVELAQSLATLSHSVSGFNVAGAANLQTTLQSQLGDQYAATVGAQVKATTAPFSGFYRDMLAGNTGSSPGQAGKNYNAMADYYDAVGDRDTADKLRGAGGALATMQTNPQIAQLQAAINRTREWQSHGLLRSGPYAATVTTNGTWETDANGKRVWRLETASDAAIRAAQEKMNTLVAQDNAANATSAAKANTPAALSAKQRGDSLADTMQQGRDQLAYSASGAASYASYAQQALDRGEGVAGMRRYAGGETSGLLNAQAALVSQQKALTDQIHTIGYNDPASGPLKAVLADVRKQLADVTGQIQAVGIGIFRQQVSEDDASYQGRSSRLGIRGNTLLLSGASAFDPRMGGNYAEQETLLRQRARHDLNLATDMTNSLSPEERQARRTQAAQETFEARYALPAEMAQRRIQQRESESAVRQSRLNLRLATAHDTGTIRDIYEAQIAQSDETRQHRNDLQAEYNRLEREGVGTLQQRQQILVQINNLEAQGKQLQQQALDAAYHAQGAEFGGITEAGSAVSRRLSFSTGTTAATYGASGVSLAAERANVDLLREKASDTGLDPSTQNQRQAEYQNAAAKLDTDTVGQYGTYQDSPQVRRQRQALEGQSRRMAVSPFFPGNRLAMASRLAGMDRTRLTGIQAQIARVRSDPTLTVDQKQNILLSLEGQGEDTQTDMAEQSASVAEQMFSSRIAMSVGSPSFASRIMPSDSDAAAIAEQRGLGPMSARVFGFTKRQTYRDTMTYGMTAPDMNLTAFGKRPGDFDSGAGLTGMGGGGLTGADSGTSGLNSALTQLTTAIHTLIQTGFKVQVATTNPSTGQQAATTVNALANHDSRGVMRGGSAGGGNSYGNR